MVKIDENILKKPIKLKNNRVYRTYIGGKFIDEMTGGNEMKDNHFPEDWIASVVEARNPGREDLLEGLSMIDQRDGLNYSLKELIDKYPIKMLGKKHIAKFGVDTGVLIKFLDSAERLTIQVHPNVVKARKLFNSEYGKTEAWYILGGREINGEKPYILLGFKKGITKEKWKDLFYRQDIKGMIECMHKIHINEGDTYIINGGLPHAIGPGCFVLEIQEPTDYTIRVEKLTPSGFKIPDKYCHQGIGFDKMFDCFDYIGYTIDEIIEKYRLNSKVLSSNQNATEKQIIGYENTTKFAMDLLNFKKSIEIKTVDSFMVLVSIMGSGQIIAENSIFDIKAGDKYFCPKSMDDAIIKSTDENKPLNILKCYPPK